MTPFIVAEMSCNHLGSLDRALAIVDTAAATGADAIKVQVWEPDTMCIDPRQAIVWQGKAMSMMALYREAWTPWEWLPILFARARDHGLVPFGAAFDRASVDLLEALDVDRHKVASFELTDLPLIRYMASKGKPMILSTGMASYMEIWEAQQCIPGGLEMTTLKCTSSYPADASDANLAAARIWPRWGLSDHSPGIGVAVAAAALGAEMIEKHLTLSRSDGGHDASFSMEPAEFARLVVECRRAAAAIGQVKLGPSEGEHPELRRSLWVRKPLREGDPLILGDNVVTARPAMGMHCDTNLAGRVARHDSPAGVPLTQGMLA